MRLPRKGILIRIVIYGSLLGYFGWQAWSRYAAQREQEQKLEQINELGIPTFEITPEQARELYGIEVDDEGNIVSPPSPSKPPSTPTMPNASGDATAPATDSPPAGTQPPAAAPSPTPAAASPQDAPPQPEPE